jgi:Ca-activated chloride channel family protein
MAQGGQGGAWFVESIEDAPAIFGAEFDDLVALYAQNVSVEIRPADPVEVAAVLNEYPATVLDAGIQVSVGDVYGGQRVRVVFKLLIPHLAGLGVQKVADLVLRYVTVGDTVAMHETTMPLTVNAVSAEEAAGATADDDVTDEVTVLLAARATDEARRLADQGRTDEAARILSEAADQLTEVAPRSDRSAALHRQAADLLRTVDELSAHAYDASSSKRLHYRSHEMKRRRREPHE